MLDQDNECIEWMGNTIDIFTVNEKVIIENIQQVKNQSDKSTNILNEYIRDANDTIKIVR